MSEMKKYIIFGLIVLSLLVAGNGMIYVKRDTKGPEITFPTDEVTYEAGTDQSILMDGVVVLDGKDGDVTDTLRVIDVLPSEDGKTAMIVYVAKDKSNNVVRKTREVNYLGNAKSSDVAEMTDVSDSEEEKNKSKEKKEETVKEEPETGTEQVSTSSQSAGLSSADPEVREANEQWQKANDEGIAQLDNNAPRIYLKQYAAQIAIGEEFDPLLYVAALKDDKDEESDLAKRVTVKGQVNNQETDEYRLEIYVVDSDGNTSNTATLAVFVK
jgi:hypothetical protein